MPAKKDEIIGALSKEQMIEPGGKVTRWMNPIRRARGFGRWVYCKYCRRNVTPRLGGLNQVTGRRLRDNHAYRHNGFSDLAYQ